MKDVRAGARGRGKWKEEDQFISTFDPRLFACPLSRPSCPDHPRSEVQWMIDTVVPCELLQVFT